LPSIPNADVKLTRLVIQGLKDRGLYDDPTKHRVDGKEVTYREQALIELKRYIEKGFAGRGSAGGSLVCYLIGIHQLDPLKWGLSSVRFMGDSRGGHLLQVKME
jgi:hypothetical protein